MNTPKDRRTSLNPMANSMFQTFTLLLRAFRNACAMAESRNREATLQLLTEYRNRLQQIHPLEDEAAWWPMVFSQRVTAACRASSKVYQHDYRAALELIRTYIPKLEQIAPPQTAD